MEPDNNFILELSTSLEEQVTSFQHLCSTIFSRNEFTDCTLCCSDGQLKAHRVSLFDHISCCQQLHAHYVVNYTLADTVQLCTMLFFKTFSLNDMKLAMEFVYTGRAKVTRNKLPTLMNIARELGCGSLSKAIEKAIHLYGVEIFRKRIQTQSQVEVASKSGHSPTHTSFPTEVFISSQSDEPTENDNRATQQRSRDVTPLINNDSHHSEAIQSTESGRLEGDDESIYARDIKIEPEQDIMIELDPSSIVTTTIDTTTLGNTNESSDATSPVGSNEFSNAQAVDVKITHNLNLSRELEANNEGFEIHDDIDSIIIGIKNKISDKDSGQLPSINILDSTGHDNNGTDMDDDQIMQDEDEEEMPITVVDLKSLAETRPDADVVGMPSSGIENMESLPANCPWCFQVFTSLTLLQRHIKTHVGKYKPYSCQYCPASFARSAHLKRHIRTHTGEKPFVCSFCSRAFSRQDKLKTHLEKHLLDQQLQNNQKLTSTVGFSSLDQGNVSLTRPNTTVKTSTSTPSTTGISPHKQIMQGISSSANFSPCILPSTAYQYFINDGPDAWQTQADRVSKGLLGVPGQITISTAISPSTTITPIPSLQSNPPPPHL